MTDEIKLGDNVEGQPDGICDECEPGCPDRSFGNHFQGSGLCRSCACEGYVDEGVED